jgi:cytochrome c biogenesis protein CcdA
LAASKAGLQGPGIGSTALLLAYAAGAATSLALALKVGGKLFAVMESTVSAIKVADRQAAPAAARAAPLPDEGPASPIEGAV